MHNLQLDCKKLTPKDLKEHIAEIFFCCDVTDNSRINRYVYHDLERIVLMCIRVPMCIRVCTHIVCV